jgi:hypothetical protein
MFISRATACVKRGEFRSAWRAVATVCMLLPFVMYFAGSHPYSGDGKFELAVAVCACIFLPTMLICLSVTSAVIAARKRWRKRASRRTIERTLRKQAPPTVPPPVLRVRTKDELRRIPISTVEDLCAEFSLSEELRNGLAFLRWHYRFATNRELLRHILGREPAASITGELTELAESMLIC